MIVYLPIGILFHLHNPSARSRTTVHKVKNPYDQEWYMSWLSMFLSNNYNYGRCIFCGPSTSFKDSEELLGKWKIKEGFG